MIHCYLEGGLGNLLFKISACISLSIDNNMDFNFPDLNIRLKYDEFLTNLSCVPIELPIDFISYPFEYVNYPPINKNTLISGYFQSEKYFKHNKEEISKYINFDFIDKNALLEKYSFFNKNTCSIHVRRGDYLAYPNLHPTLSMEYYKKAIDFLKEKTDIFVVFSDDIDWCKENFSFLENVYFIENEKDYIDMFLMSMCENNIISNSTFSWWGAWLNKNNNKIVIAPSMWFGPELLHNTNDIIPDNWIKI